MEQARKTTWGILVLIAVYIGLAILGLYSYTQIVIFPIIAIPCIVYFIRHTLQLREFMLFQFCTSIGVLIVTGSFVSVGIYLMSVCIPSLIITKLYHNNYTLPNLVLAATVIISLTVLLFLIAIRSIGIDFEAQYGEALDQMGATIISQIEAQALLVQQDLPENVVTNFKANIIAFMEVMKQTYSARILIGIMISTTLAIVISNSIARIKNRHLPSCKEFLEFRLSKFAVLIFFISILMLVSSSSGVWTLVGLNVMCVLSMLFQMVGILALVGVISRVKSSRGIKFIGYFMILILSCVFPSFITTYACLDTLFNYRKTKIVV